MIYKANILNGKEMRINIQTFNCSSEMTSSWWDPCISGLRERSCATSSGSGNGAPLPSKTTRPTTGARCISWISLAEKVFHKEKCVIVKTSTLTTKKWGRGEYQLVLPACAITWSSILRSTAGRRSM